MKCNKEKEKTSHQRTLDWLKATKKQRLAIYIDKADMNKIRKQAKSRDMSLNAWITKAIAWFLARD